MHLADAAPRGENPCGSTKMSGTFLDTEGTRKGEPQDAANRGRKQYLRPIEILKKELGEVSEWSKEHAWKVCVSQGTEGSNPSLTAIIKKARLARAFLIIVRKI